MYFTFSLKEIALIALILVTLIFVVYLIKVMRKLLVTLETSNEILGNIETITDIAERRTEAVDVIVEGISAKVEDIASSRKGKDTVVKQLSVIANAITTIITSIGGKKNRKDDCECYDETMEPSENTGETEKTVKADSEGQK